MWSGRKVTHSHAQHPPVFYPPPRSVKPQTCVKLESIFFSRPNIFPSRQTQSAARTQQSFQGTLTLKHNFPTTQKESHEEKAHLCRAEPTMWAGTTLPTISLALGAGLVGAFPYTVPQGDQLGPVWSRAPRSRGGHSLRTVPEPLSIPLPATGTVGIPDEGGGTPASIHPIGPPAAAVLLGEVCIHAALVPTLFFGQLCIERLSLPHTPFFQAVVSVFSLSGCLGIFDSCYKRFIVGAEGAARAALHSIICGLVALCQ